MISEFTPETLSILDVFPLFPVFLLGSMLKGYNSQIETHMSHEKKTSFISFFPLYWLVNRDPYNGLL